MNSFKCIEVDYIRPSRTIETILVSNSVKEKLFYVYNYEGWFFRVFDNILSLIAFFDEKIESDIYFESDDELDSFLSSVDL